MALQKLGLIPKKKDSFRNMTSARANEDDASLEGVVRQEESGNENDTVTALQVS